jgi:hypothetical protein
MGLLDFIVSLFGGEQKIDCPNCGTPDARKSRDGRIHCRNQTCPNFDPSLALGRYIAPVPTRGNFVPEHSVSIRYVNFVGQSRDFCAERDSLVRKRNHIIAEVAPTGRRITLSRDRIQNLDEVESYMPKRVEPGQNWPTARERQILNYHKNHGTTSPRYQQLRAKYPNW